MQALLLFAALAAVGLKGAAASTAAINLLGTGSTFVEDVLVKWSDVYPSVRKKVALALVYTGVGSGTGKANLISETPVGVTYAFSDSKLSDAEIARSNGTIRLLPAVVGALNIIYNIPTLSSSYRLVLSREALLGIFNASIRAWDHPLILVNNPTVALNLTGQNISVVTRSDSSGSTEIMSRAMSSISPLFKSTYGIFSAANVWPGVAFKESGTSALILRVLRTNNAVGYAEVTASVTYNAASAILVNRFGWQTFANTSSIQSAIADSLVSSNSSLNATNAFIDVVDGTGQSSYPLTAYSYLVLRNGYPTDCTTNYELFRFAYWFLTDDGAANLARKQNFEVITPELRTLVFNIMADFRCSNGLKLLETVLRDVDNELKDTNSMLFMAGIISSVSIMFITLGSLFLYWRLLQARRMREVKENQAQTVQLAKRPEDSPVRKRILFGVHIVAEVALIALDFVAFYELPGGLTLAIVYLIVVCIGAVMVFVYLLLRYRLMVLELSEGQSVHLMKGDMKVRASGAPPIHEVAARHAYLKRLLYHIRLESIEKLTILVREIPIIFISLLIFFQNISIDVLVLLNFGANCITLGLKARTIFVFIEKIEHYITLKYLVVGKKPGRASILGAVLRGGSRSSGVAKSGEMTGKAPEPQDAKSAA